MTSSSGLFDYDPSLQKALTSGPSKVVPFSAIAQASGDLLSEDLLQNQLEAFVQFSSGKACVLPVQTLGQKPALKMKGGANCQVCIKTGYVQEDNVFVTKVAAGGAEGYGNTGLMMTFSQSSLRLDTLLLDEGILTEMRTAAASAAASRFFVDGRKVTKIGLVGGGIQAIWQLRYLNLVTDCRNVIVKTSSAESARKFKDKMALSSCSLDKEWNFEIYTLEQGFQECQLIHTVTYARKAVVSMADLVGEGDMTSRLGGDWIHITAVGADSVGKQELEDDLIEAAQVCCMDSRKQSQERGEFQRVEEMDQRFIEFGILLQKSRKGYSAATGMDSPGLSIFDTSGIATQDVGIAKFLAQKLEDK